MGAVMSAIEEIAQKKGVIVSIIDTKISAPELEALGISPTQTSTLINSGIVDVPTLIQKPAMRLLALPGISWPTIRRIILALHEKHKKTLVGEPEYPASIESLDLKDASYANVRSNGFYELEDILKRDILWLAFKLPPGIFVDLVSALDKAGHAPAPLGNGWRLQDILTRQADDPSELWETPLNELDVPLIRRAYEGHENATERLQAIRDALNRFQIGIPRESSAE